MTGSSLEERLAALRARRAEHDPVELAGRPRSGWRRWPARRARIGVTAAATVGFVALVPVMGPLTAGPDGGQPDEPVDGPADGPRTAVPQPESSVAATIVVGAGDPTSTTIDSATSLPGATVDPSTATPVPGAPVPGVAAPVPGVAAPQPPAPRPAPTGAPAAPTPATPPPATPAPVPVAPAPSPAPTAAPAPSPTAPPSTAAPTTAPPPPPPPPTTAAPPPPVTSPS